MLLLLRKRRWRRKRRRNRKKRKRWPRSRRIWTRRKRRREWWFRMKRKRKRKWKGRCGGIAAFTCPSTPPFPLLSPHCGRSLHKLWGCRWFFKLFYAAPQPFRHQCIFITLLSSFLGKQNYGYWNRRVKIIARENKRMSMKIYNVHFLHYCQT